MMWAAMTLLAVDEGWSSTDTNLRCGSGSVKSKSHIPSFDLWSVRFHYSVYAKKRLSHYYNQQSVAVHLQNGYGGLRSLPRTGRHQE